jgi:hypothetical protein
MKKLNLGQTISTIANVGVIAGIIFLGYELRQNTSAARQEARAILLGAKITEQLPLSTNAGGITNIWVKANNGDRLSETEYLQLAVSRDLSLFSYSTLYKEYQSGMLTESDIPINQWGYVLRQPAVRQVWDQLKSGYDPAFVQWVEEAIYAAE